MKYTVVWVSKAERELTTIWLNATDRAVVTEAAAAIDRELHIDPTNVGESRADNDRILIIPPLVAKYDILPNEPIVRVLNIWQFSKRR